MNELLNRLWLRLGWRYLTLVWVGEIAVGVALAPLIAAAFSIYVKIDGRTFALVSLTAGAQALFAALVGARYRQRELRPMRLWLQDGRSATKAADARAAALNAPITSVSHALIAGLATLPVADLLVALELHLTVGDAFLVVLGSLTMGALTSVTEFVILDLLMAPLRRDIAETEGARAEAGNSLILLQSTLYARLGPSYLPVLGSVLLLYALYVAPLCAAILLLYIPMTTLKFVVVTMVLACVPLIAATVALRRAQSAALTVTGWQRDGGEVGSAWDAAIRLPVELTIGYLAASVVVSPVAGVVVGSVVLDRPVSDVAFLALAGVGAATFVTLFCGLIAESGMRPVLADMAARLPRDFAISRPGSRLGSRLFLATAATAACGGGFAMMFAGRQGSLHELASAGVVVVILVVPIGIALVRLIVESVTTPVGDLVAASRRVAAGDFSVHIPLGSEDELGVLTSSFNRMISGLRERELLREQNVELDSALQASLNELRLHAEELRASRARIVAAADDARRRVERDLHDGAQQHLVLLQLKLGLVQRRLENDPEGAELLEELRGELARALAELRDLAHGIYPSILETEGLEAALREASVRSAVPVRCECDGVRRYPRELEAAVYFCCLEALQNVAKHAGEDATATVRLFEDGDELRFEVSDDGAGFDAAIASGSAGVQNMTDRIGALGGRLRVDTSPGRGTSVLGAVPLGKAQSSAASSSGLVTGA